MTHLLTTRTHLPHPRDKVFEFFSKAENLGRITPPELNFKILTPLPIDIQEGTQIDYQIGLFGVPMLWRTAIAVWNPPAEFIDVQLRGPYKVWRHTHRFYENDDATTLMEDVVHYELPFGPLGNVAHPLVRLQLNRIFAYRESVVRRLL